MAAQKGSDIILRISDPNGGSPTVFTAIGGLRTKTITLNAETVDITSADSTNKWRELLAGAGIKSASVSGAGVFKDDAADLLIRNSFFSQTHLTWQLEIPSFAILEGTFQISQLQFAGEHNGETTYDLSLESASEVFAGAI